MKYAEQGTVSHGTLRNEDLLATFADTLESLVQDNAKHWNGRQGERDRLLGIVWDAREISDFDSEEASDMVSALTDALDKFSPPGHSFGAHEGDGSDFGFWPCEPTNPFHILQEHDYEREAKHLATAFAMAHDDLSEVWASCRTIGALDPTLNHLGAFCDGDAFAPWHVPGVSRELDRYALRELRDLAQAYLEALKRDECACQSIVLPAPAVAPSLRLYAVTELLEKAEHLGLVDVRYDGDRLTAAPHGRVFPAGQGQRLTIVDFSNTEPLYERAQYILTMCDALPRK